MYKRVGPTGYGSKRFKKYEENLRTRKENWFALVGCIGQTSETAFLIGEEWEDVAQAFGELCCYANDLNNMYWNNWGKLTLTIKEIT